MPTYEYVCLSCERHIEVVQRFSDEPLRTCPHCGGPLRRVFHPVGIVLKGSGFYSTDNRSGSKRVTADTKKDGSSETTTTETKTTEKKTEKKSSSDGASSSSDSGSGSSSGSGSGDSGSSSKKKK